MQEVSKQKVQFQSEGLKVVGNLYVPANSEDRPLSGVLVAGTMTGVKQQVAGNYSERIAKAGYTTLALDHRHFGDSKNDNSNDKCNNR
jgi:fermentation-respiration switch protein FrsA (DUF1100 family)